MNLQTSKHFKEGKWCGRGSSKDRFKTPSYDAERLCVTLLLTIVKRLLLWGDISLNSSFESSSVYSLVHQPCTLVLFWGKWKILNIMKHILSCWSLWMSVFMSKTFCTTFKYNIPIWNFFVLSWREVAKSVLAQIKPWNSLYVMSNFWKNKYMFITVFYFKSTFR